MMNNYDRIYNDVDEREIRTVFLYVKNGKVYVDGACKKMISFDDAMMLCGKGVVQLVDTGTYYTISSYIDAGGTLTIGYGNGKTATVSLASPSSVG